MSAYNVFTNAALPPSPEGKAPSNVRPRPLLTILALALGLYGGFDWGLGSIGAIPNPIGGALGLLLLLIHSRRIAPRFIISIAWLSLLYLVSGVYAVIDFDLQLISLLPTLMLIYTILGVYGIVLDLMLWRRKSVERLGLIGALVVLAGCTAEVATPLGTIMADYANFLIQLSGHVSVWDNSGVRDLELFGTRRPTFLTSEPSFAGTGFAVFASIWILVKRTVNLRTTLLIWGITLLATLVIRSPFPLVTLVFWGVSVSMNGGSAARIRLGALGALVASSPIFLVLLAFMSSLFAVRLSFATGGQDWSTITRTYGAIFVGWEAALERPVLGFGPGNIETFEHVMRTVYFQFGVPESIMSANYFESSLNNGLGAILSYFGIIGAIFYFILMSNILRLLAPKVEYFLFFLFILVIGFWSGSIYGYRFIWPIFLLVFATGGVFSGDNATIQSQAIKPKRRPRV